MQIGSITVEISEFEIPLDISNRQIFRHSCDRLTPHIREHASLIFHCRTDPSRFGPVEPVQEIR